MARGKEHVLGDRLGLSPVLPPPSADDHSYPLPSLPPTPWDLSDLLLCFGRVGDRLRISMSGAFAIQPRHVIFLEHSLASSGTIFSPAMRLLHALTSHGHPSLQVHPEPGGKSWDARSLGSCANPGCVRPPSFHLRTRLSAVLAASLNPHASPMRQYYDLHFTEGETEAQRGPQQL